MPLARVGIFFSPRVKFKGKRLNTQQAAVSSRVTAGPWTSVVSVSRSHARHTYVTDVRATLKSAEGRPAYAPLGCLPFCYRAPAPERWEMLIICDWYSHDYFTSMSRNPQRQASKPVVCPPGIVNPCLTRYERRALSWLASPRIDTIPRKSFGIATVNLGVFFSQPIFYVCVHRSGLVYLSDTK